MKLCITGINRGIGLELTRQYLQKGHEVYGTLRHHTPKEPLKSLQAKYSENCHLIPGMDVTHPADLQNLKGALHGIQLDRLINNAGVFGTQKQNLSEISNQDMQSVFQTNTIAPLLVTRTLLPLLKEGCKIALITSKMGSITDNTSGGYYAYRASKAALNMVGTSLAQDLEPQKITVLLLHPGWVQTDMGGPSAPIDAPTSAQGLIQVIEEKSLSESGSFLDYQGKPIAW